MRKRVFGSIFLTSLVTLMLTAGLFLLAVHAGLTRDLRSRLAKEAEVKELWLTHYSPSLTRPEEFMDSVRNIFPNAWPGKDGKSVDLTFEED